MIAMSAVTEAPRSEALPDPRAPRRALRSSVDDRRNEGDTTAGGFDELAQEQRRYLPRILRGVRALVVDDDRDNLELFAAARNWKHYVARACAPFLRGHVLEVGAGLGGSTASLLAAADVREWTALEPDPELLARQHRGLHRIRLETDDDSTNRTLARMARPQELRPELEPLIGCV